LIADEPTTALDVTVQAQILDLMQELKDEIGSSILLITHNLGVIAEKANNVIVMYAGRIMECADVQSLFGNPLHPYTIGLMNSIPQPYKKKAGQGMLHVIPGVVPNLINLPEGCKFNNRCERVLKKCHKKEPHLVEVTPGHTCRCWLFDEKA
jgi:oligopeptide/dipeptide ABC transporter ATP-binding protein